MSAPVVSPEQPPAPAGALYRAVWRWHFFAGLFVAPFAVFLAITGSLYLWKPQFEEWKYRDLFNVTVPAGAVTLTVDAQLTAARAAFPELNPVQFIPASHAGRSAEVQFGAPRDPEKVSVFVNPHTGAVLGRIDDATRPMRILHDLHGTLLAGTAGEIVIELAATWAFVLMVSGLYLWWPRPFTVGGFLLPRLGSGGRALLRDLHAVPAVWLSVFTLFLLATGIQWTPVGGKWSRTLAQLAGEWQPRETQASAHRSELLGGWSPYLNSKAKAEQAAAVASTPPAADPHAEHRRGSGRFADDPDRISLQRVIAIAAERQVADAYAIALPQSPTGVYSILSDRNRAFSRAYVHLDQYSGRVLADIRFKDFGAMGKFYTFGIIAHEGQLFGLPNQLLGLITCLGIVTLAITGVAMWWSRRPAGRLTAPEAPKLFSVSKGAVVIAVFLAALLPLMAASLVLLLLLDWLLTPLATWFKAEANRSALPLKAAAALLGIVLTITMGVLAVRRPSPQAAAKSVAPSPSSYPLTGEIVAVTPARGAVLVHHEEIPGYMPPMTMEFLVTPVDLARLKERQRIRARLVLDPKGELRLEAVEVLDPVKEATVKAAANQLRQDTAIRGKEAYREIGETVPEFTLYSQNGEVVPSSRFRGRRVVLNFIYTRCPIATMCPASTLNMMALQRAAREAGVVNLELVSITLDPAYDKPSVLKEYAAVRGIDTTNFSFLTGPEGAVRDLLHQFGVIVQPGENFLKHTLSTLLIDENGKIIHRVDGTQWSPEEFLQRLPPAMKPSG